MRKWILVFLGILLVLPGLYFLFLKDFLSGPQQIYRFRKTSKIDLIRITGEDTTELRKEKGTWQLRDGEAAEEIAVNNILYALDNMEVIGMSMGNLPQDSGRTLLIQTGSRRKTFKVYPAKQGIRISLPEETKSYFLGLSGKEGPGLFSVFNDDPAYWEARKLVSFDSPQIRSVRVLPGEDPDEAFLIEQANDSLTLWHQNKEIEVNSDNYEKLLMYASFFTDVYTISRLTDAGFIQQLKSHKPWYTIMVNEKSPGTHTFDFFRAGDVRSQGDLFEGYLIYNHTGCYRINFSEVDLWFAKYSDFVDE